MSEGGGGREVSIWEIHEAQRPARTWRQLPVALFVLVNAVQGLAATFPARRQELLTERVRRYAQEHILAVTTRVDLAAFDDPTFHDRVQRATQGVMIGPIGLVQGFIMIVQGALGALGVVLALTAISPLLVLIVLAGYLPVWIVIQANGMDRFRFFRLQTPLQRRRDYLSMHPAGPGLSDGRLIILADTRHRRPGGGQPAESAGRVGGGGDTAGTERARLVQRG